MSDLETEKRNLKFVAKCSSRSHNCEKGNFTSWKGCERLLTLTLTHPKRSTLLFGIVKYANLGSSCRRRSRDCLRFLITSYYEPGLRKLNRNKSRKLARNFFPLKLLQFLIKQNISRHIFSQSGLNEKLPVKRSETFSRA